MASLAAGRLDDLCAMVFEPDVAMVIAEGVDTYDAIQLDVDNGPDGVVREANNGIYALSGLLLPGRRSGRTAEQTIG